MTHSLIYFDIKDREIPVKTSIVSSTCLTKSYSRLHDETIKSKPLLFDITILTFQSSPYAYDQTSDATDLSS